MDRLPRSWISVQDADSEAHRLEKASSNPTKAEVAALWERPVYTGTMLMLCLSVNMVLITRCF